METGINILFQSLGTWLYGIAEALSFLGTEIFYILVMPAVYWCVDAIAGLRLGMVIVLSGSLNGFFKFFFKSPRPYWVDEKVIPVTRERSFGMPSGHAMNAASLWAQVSYEFKKQWLTWLCIAMIILIGLSRLVLGVHFSLDVSVGWFMGLILFLLFNRYYRPVANWVKPMPLARQLGFSLLSSLLLVGLIIVTSWPGRSWVMPADWAEGAGQVNPFDPRGLYTIAGLWLGFMAGFFILRQQLGILESGKGGVHALWRYLLGLFGIVLIYMGLGEFLPKALTASTYIIIYLHSALLGLWISYLAPLLFKALKIASFKRVHLG